jgi:hypothetical protein
MSTFSQLQSGTADGLMLFLQVAPTTGWLKEATAKSYRAAVSQILDVTAAGQDLDQLKIRDLNVEEALVFFKEVQHEKYTEGSMASYQTRFRKAVDMYKQFLDNPKSLRPAPERRTVRHRVDDPSVSMDWAEWTTVRSVEVDQGTIDYPFPLISGGTAHLHLPRELHPADVERLIKFLRSIAIDPGGQGRLHMPDLPE